MRKRLIVLATGIAVTALAVGLVTVAWPSADGSRDVDGVHGSSLSLGAEALGVGDTGRVVPAPSVARALKLRAGTSVQRARFTIRNGHTVDVFTAEREDGRQCLVEQLDDGGGGGGCDVDLFPLGPIAFSEASSGGPDPATIREYRLIGLLQPPAVQISIIDSVGRAHEPTAMQGRAFIYEGDPAALADGVFVSALVAHDARGREVGRIEFPKPGS